MTEKGTPLWRNGPPEKPVLCNACGSRYRLRGTLVNYTPKHILNLPINKKKKKRNTLFRTFSSESNFKAYEENVSSSFDFEGYISNKSSSESTSHPESYLQKEQEDGLGQIPAGQVQSHFLDFPIPSRKRSFVAYCNPSPIERLQRDLHQILKYQDPSNNILSKSQEDVLLYNVNNQIAPFEIGLGTILLKQPNINSTQTGSILDNKVPSFHGAQQDPHLCK